jgi:hypothetical protein
MPLPNEFIFNAKIPTPFSSVGILLGLNQEKLFD